MKRFSHVGAHTRRYWLEPIAGEAGTFGCDVVALLIATAIWYLISYDLYPFRPTFTAHGYAGWLGAPDQDHYLQSTIDLAHGQLKPTYYWFGYPILGVPFYWLLPRHAYLIPNLAMVVAIVGLFYAACRHYMGRLEGLVLVWVFIWFDSFLRDECLIIPWNTMPAYAAFFLCIYLLILKPGPGRPFDFAVCAFACGLAMFARPSEIGALGIIYLFGLAKLRTWKERMWAAGLMGAIVLVVGGVTLGLTYYFYQGLQSPYMKKESTKASLVNYGLKLYQFLYDSRFLTGGNNQLGIRPSSLLTRYPEFLFVIPGFLFLVKDRGWIAWGLIMGIAVEVGIYLIYNPFNNMPYAWRNSQWHYIAWLLPWLGFVTYLSFRQAFFRLPRGLFFGMLFFPAFIAGVVGFRAVPLASATAQSGENLRLETSFENDLYDVTLTVLKPCRIDDVRLLFRRSPVFDGTDAASILLTAVWVNNVRQRDMSRRSVSQDGNTWHVSFLAHSLILNTGDKILIDFYVPEAPDLDQAQLVGVEFAPMQAIRDYFEMR